VPDNLPRGTICIEDIGIGMSRQVTKTVTDRDIALFAEVSTDRNPVQLDEAYARDMRFAGPISAVIGEQLPGPGTVYPGQHLRFPAPVRPGDTVRAEVTVTAIDHAKRRVTLETRAAVGKTVVVKGKALVPAPGRKFD